MLKCGYVKAWNGNRTADRMVGMTICYPLSEGYHMRGWNIMWYNCESNFGGVAIVIAAADIVIVAGCWEDGEEDVWCVEPFSSVIATCVPQSN